MQGIEHLCLRFGENVDRRTIEKVLSAAGAMLGDISVLPSEGVRLYSLHNLEVDFLVGGTVPPPTDQVGIITDVTMFFTSSGSGTDIHLPFSRLSTRACKLFCHAIKRSKNSDYLTQNAAMLKA